MNDIIAATADAHTLLNHTCSLLKSSRAQMSLYSKQDTSIAQQHDTVRNLRPSDSMKRCLRGDKYYV